MRNDPFSRPQAGYGSPGVVSNNEPGLGDPGGFMRGNIRPRGVQTGGGAPRVPMNTGPLPPRTGGPGQQFPQMGAPMPANQAGGLGAPAFAGPAPIGAPIQPAQFPMRTGGPMQASGYGQPNPYGGMTPEQIAHMLVMGGGYR